MPMLLPPPELATVGDPTVLPLIVPDSVPEPSLSTPMPLAVTFWTLLPSIVIVVVLLPCGSINAPLPPAPPTPTPLTWLSENVTLSVPVEAESVANWNSSPVLPVNVEPVTLTVAFVLPSALMISPWLLLLLVSLAVLLLNVLAVTVRFSVPLVSVMIALFTPPVVKVLFAIVTMPVTPEPLMPLPLAPETVTFSMSTLLARSIPSPPELVIMGLDPPAGTRE